MEEVCRSLMLFLMVLFCTFVKHYMNNVYVLTSTASQVKIKVTSKKRTNIVAVK